MPQLVAVPLLAFTGDSRKLWQLPCLVNGRMVTKMLPIEQVPPAY